MNALIIDQVCKKYGKTTALRGVSMEIGAGCCGLLGPNGAGKTTLIHILATLLRPDSGSIRMGEIDWKRPDAVRERIGFVPQRFGMYPYVTVEELLGYFACLKRVPAKEEKREIERALALTGMREKRRERVGRLSGGMLRRAAIAQSLLGSPQLLLMDEPTAGLDPEERIRFRNTLSAVSQETTILLSTHIVEDISACCSQAVILNKGAVLACGSLPSLRALAKGKAFAISGDEYERCAERPEALSRGMDEKGRETLVIRRPIPGSRPLEEPSLEESYMLLRMEAGERAEAGAIDA